MRRWDLAYANYTSMRGEAHGQSGRLISDAAIEQAKLRLTEIKSEIDRLIAQSAELRRTSPDALNFSVIEIQVADLSGVSQTLASEPKAQQVPFKDRDR